MYDRFTDRARKVMQLANQEAQRFKHEYIGTEHILLGLVKEDNGVAVTALKNLGVERHRIRIEIEKLILEGSPGSRTGKLPQTPRAKKVVEYAMEEAWTLNHDYVGTEHFLLGLLREDEAVAAQVLMNLGLRLDKVRAEIQAILQAWPEQEGRNEYSGLCRIRSVNERPKSVETLPAACPKCGDAHLVRVLWHCTSHLFRKDQEDVDAGKAILGSCSDITGPPWVCLRCSPAWSEVHAFATQDHKLQRAKEDAVASKDFETAARCRDAQVDLRRQYYQIVEVLLKSQ